MRIPSRWCSMPGTDWKIQQTVFCTLAADSEAQLEWENHIASVPIAVKQCKVGCWFWRRGSESNRRIRVLQTLALPLGYRAIIGENVEDLVGTCDVLFGTYRACLLEVNSAGDDGTTGNNTYE